ncbi:uncharacterized protein LOC112087461 [Eutrema salsugineum]|uniref:uncharacterized protein LOC112087461 n=1 Tax=Eutrema salsugineum TaxID=72664 RepID=UPI000CECFA89|nr:uncharacterized protein LOC112087461 [Eutrema salsugineum]
MASNMRLTPLADLKPFKTGWKVQVKGTKIHATVKKNLLHRFERLMVVDVIGRVESVRELETIPVMNKDTSKLEFDLCNAKEECLPCTLWGKFGEQVYSAFQNVGERGVIIVIRFEKINVFRGERQITSSFQTSKVLIDLHDPDVIDFKNSLPANDGNITFLSSKPHQRIFYDGESNFDQFPMVTIAELQDYLEIQDPYVVPDVLQNLVGKTFQFLICVEKENLYSGSNTYKVEKVWKGNQVLTTTVDDANESEDGGDQSLLMYGDQASLMNTHSQESSDDVSGNIKTLLSKRERDDPKDSVDSSSSSKKSCNSGNSVEKTYANEVID